jgi:phenylalanyl-tRNA synthetase alpha chain
MELTSQVILLWLVRLAIMPVVENLGLKNKKPLKNIMHNITPSIESKFDKLLYKLPNHPLCIVKDKVFEYFDDLARIEIGNPYISVEDNFDRLRVPQNHPSRRPTDTYYKDDKTCLRTHMTCYLFSLGQSQDGDSKLRYITCGDVYRKDSIDSTHYPVFHQMDAFYIVDDDVDVKKDLRNRLIGLVKHLFGNTVDYQFMEDSEYEEVYFPFTVDSLEINVSLPDENGKIKQLEVLGAGTVHPDIMKDLGLQNKKAWAIGLGLERLAMAMFEIPDIRLFWSVDKRFTNQFKAGQITKFKPYSKYEVCYKDVSFFLSKKFSYNDLCSIARDVDPHNLIESIKQIDEFEIKGRTSHCYRVMYRSMDGTLRNSEVNKIQKTIVTRLISELEVEIR